MMICLIFVEHTFDALFGEAHIDIKVCRDVPWTVDFVSVVGAYFTPQMFHIGHTGEDDGLESLIFRISFSLQII